MRKTVNIALILLLALFTLNCSSSKSLKKDDARKWKYFKILADADDNKVFVKLQDELGIEPKMERYTIVVNIVSKDPQLQYILFGDEESSNPPKFPWSRLSKDVQDGLINWTGDNKVNLNY
jgi:hypothetical protein